MGFEALAAYALNEKNRFIYQMEITVESTYVPGWSYNVSFTSENFAQAHHIEVYFFFLRINHIYALNKLFFEINYLIVICRAKKLHFWSNVD